MIEQFKKLIDVKSIVTIILTLTFVALSVMGQVTSDRFFEIFIMIISFYFGTQYQKNNSNAGSEKNAADE